MKRRIDAHVYDENIQREGIQVQIDNYYQPKTLPQQRRIKIVIDILNPQANEKILDIGSGAGTFAYASAQKGSIAFGVDYSHESMKVATQLANEFNTNQRSFFTTASALELPYQDNSFDKIVCADFIERITNKEKTKLRD